MQKNILNHYTTKKGRKHKKLGIGSNEHSGEGSVTQKKNQIFVLREVRKQNKGRTPKKI